jgi:hypothetical protein
MIDNPFHPRVMAQLFQRMPDKTVIAVSQSALKAARGHDLDLPALYKHNYRVPI